MKKVAILYLNTGWGHIGYARALEKGIKRKYPDSEVILFNPITDNIVLKAIIEHGYSLTMKNTYTGSIFDRLAKIWDLEQSRHISGKVLSLSLKSSFEDFFLTHHFDYVISTHFFLSDCALNTLNSLNLGSKFFHLVADPFTPHEIWFDVKDCTYLVESDQVKKMCLDHGISEEDIAVFPMILDEKFTTQLSPSKKLIIKKSFSLSPKQKIVLIIGGWEWIPNGKKMLQQFLKYPFFVTDMKIFVVCWKNEELYDSLNNLLKNHPKADLFHIFWYSTQVYELMNIADLVICKAGPATIFEVLSQWKPMIIYKKFWPQEEGNVEYVLKHHVGIFEPKLEFLPGLVDAILLNEELQHTFKKRIQNLHYHNGLDDCIDYLFSFS